MLPVPYRLRAGKDIRKVYARRRKFAGDILVLHVAGTQSPKPRVCFVVSKKVGDAVVRNRVKRKLRHIWKALIPGIHQNVDCVVVCRSGSSEADFDTLQSSLIGLVQKSGII